jgi:FKBP-type peptidyl-prolyl cis-trans isomerase FkpA
LTRARALIAGAAAVAALLQPALASAAAPVRKPAAAAAVPAAPRIGFTVVSEGTGPSPGPEDIVLIAYIGRLTDGTVFDQDGQAVFPVGEMVTGFKQAIQRMKRGGSYHVTIPPALGYGAEASAAVPANSTLTFDILLFEFKTKAEVEAIRQRGQTSAPPPAPAAP